MNSYIPEEKQLHIFFIKLKPLPNIFVRDDCKATSKVR